MSSQTLRPVVTRRLRGRPNNVLFCYFCLDRVNSAPWIDDVSVHVCPDFHLFLHFPTTENGSFEIL